MSLSPRSYPTRQLIVDEARRWIGTPYLHQASVFQVGCDCLGLVRGVWRAVVGPEPEKPGVYSPDWAEAGSAERLLEAGRRHFKEADMGNWRAGDVLVFRWQAHTAAKHLGVATSPATMIHAHEGASVCEISVSSQWRRKLAAVFEFPDIRDC
jgi:NlpC/P60 family putative phage cell wall peptidase